MPTFGWPANGISARGVKIRTRAVFAGSSGGNTKRCLGEIELVRDGLHLSVRKTARIGNDRHRVAAELPISEDVDCLKCYLHSRYFPRSIADHARNSER